MNRTLASKLALTLLTTTASSWSLAQSSVINIDQTVTGNQEQPKVLYIVPWKTAANSEQFEQSLSQKTTGKVFQHLDKEELKRQVNFLKENSATDTQ